MNDDIVQEIALAVSLLLEIRSDCSGGRTKIDMSNLNNIAMDILRRQDLVVCRSLEKEFKYYVGLSEKGHKVCDLLEVVN